MGAKPLFVLLHINAQALFFGASTDLIKKSMYVCMSWAVMCNQTSEDCDCCHLKHAEHMLPASEPFSLSKDASINQCGNIPFSLPVFLSFDENFWGKFSSITLHWIQLDGQNEMRVWGQIFNLFNRHPDYEQFFFRHGMLSINSINVASSFCGLRTLIKSKTKKLLKMLTLLNLTFHFKDMKIIINQLKLIYKKSK